MKVSANDRMKGGIEKLLTSFGNADTQKCFAFLVAPSEQFASCVFSGEATFPVWC